MANLVQNSIHKDEGQALCGLSLQNQLFLLLPWQVSHEGRESCIYLLCPPQFPDQKHILLEKGEGVVRMPFYILSEEQMKRQ